MLTLPRCITLLMCAFGGHFEHTQLGAGVFTPYSASVRDKTQALVVAASLGNVTTVENLLGSPHRPGGQPVPVSQLNAAVHKVRCFIHHHCAPYNLCLTHRVEMHPLRASGVL